MADENNITITKKKTQQVFDLKEIFSVEEGEKIPAAFAKEFGQQMEELMIIRCQEGDDINGEKFAPYSSKRYADEKGVGVNDVDMILTGDMLGSLETKVKSGKVTVQITGEKNLLKSFNHNTGDSKGMPERKFFGVIPENKAYKKVVRSMKSELKAGFKEKRKAEDKRISKVLESLEVGVDREGSTRDFFEGVFFGNSDT
jgi:hypothetical protein